MAHRNDKALDFVPSATAVLLNTSKYGSSATVGHGCYADVFGRTDERTDRRSHDEHGGVHDLDAL
jgi:hypothetical protein